MTSIPDFGKYVQQTLPPMNVAQLEAEVGARLIEFNRVEALLARKIEQGGTASVDDWLVVNTASTFHRLAHQELKKKAEAASK